MNILTISKLRKEFNGDVLFDNISFDINSGDKIAVIGKNGTGKSTLLKMIQGHVLSDNGDIFINGKANIGYLSQDVIEQNNHTLEEEMLLVFKDIINLELRLRDVTKELEEDPHNDELLHRYAQMEHQYSVLGGYHYHTDIDMIMSKFGFKPEEYNRLISTFSGGEKTRAAFAKLLLQKPDLLILDEPTNHLDIEIIDWLEDYLNKYDGAVLLVTHDKYFISKVCRKIVEIDHHTSHIYHGTFAEYEEEKIKRYEQLLRQYNRQQKEIEHLQSFIDRFRYNAKKASMAKDRAKKLSRIDRIDKPHVTKRRVHLDFEQNRRTTREIIVQAKNLSIGYNNTPLLQSINFSMRGYDKLAIVGPNGTGKTTLLKVIEHKLKPLKGKVDHYREFNIGYFDQNQQTLSSNKTIFEEIHDLYPMFTNYDVRSIAAKFLFFNEDLDKPISILSGGEKVRLVLCLLMLEKPDLLILDEPTNHLDIETKDIVEDVLSQFNGPIIFVSHDRYFINRVATKIVYLSHNKAVEFNGSYDDYKELLTTEQKKQKIKTVKNNTDNPMKRIRDMEDTIHKVEQEIESLRRKTFEKDIYEDYQTINRINKEIEQLEQSLIVLEEEYFETLSDWERKEV